MRNTLFFAIFFVIFSTHSFAQSNFVPGYIIKLNGDTVKGELDYRNWETNPLKVTFRYDGMENIYTTKDIDGFGCTEDSYKRFTLDMSVGTKIIDNMVANEMPVIVKDTTVFLRLLVSSDLDLYIYHDKFVVDHFYFIKDGKANELIHQKALIQRSGNMFVVEQNTYREQLLDILNPSNSLASKIKSAQYTLTNITAIFEKHNIEIGKVNISNSKKINNKKVDGRKIAVDLDVLIGFNSQNPTFSGGTETQSLPYKFKKSFAPMAGMGITVYLPRNRKQFSLDNQLVYSSYSIASEGVYKIDTYHNVSDFQLKASYIKLVSIFKYQYPKGVVRPFIGIGVSNGWALNVNYDYYLENTLMTNYSERKPFYNDIRKYEQALVFALGANYRKFKFELRNDRSNGVSPLAFAKSTINYYQFSLGYTIN